MTKKDHILIRMILIRGCRTSAAPVVVLNGTAGSVSDPVSIPVADTTTNQNLILHGGAHAEDIGTDWINTWTSPNITGGTSLFENGSTLGNGGGLAAYVGTKATAGSLGTCEFDMQNLTQPLNVARATYAFLPVGT